MDVLTNKQTKSYDYLSRYATFDFAYNTLDNKFMYFTTRWLDENTAFVLHTVKSEDTLDSLAYTYYGRPDYYWVIANFNRIHNPLEELHKTRKTIKIPTLTSISFKE